MTLAPIFLYRIPAALLVDLQPRKPYFLHERRKSHADWLPVVSGLAGSGVLLYGTVLLVSGARLGVTSTLKEMDFVSGLITRHKGDDVLS